MTIQTIPARTAWTFAEDQCASLGLPHDIRPVAWCGAPFLAHVLPMARVLGGTPA